MIEKRKRMWDCLPNRRLSRFLPPPVCLQSMQSGVSFAVKGESKMNQIEIGKYIAECRKAKKLTQAQLAEKLNITDRAVSKWETRVSHS